MLAVAEFLKDLTVGADDIGQIVTAIEHIVHFRYGGGVKAGQIQIGQAVGQDWLVTGGLKAGERVVIVGVQKVKPGAKVKPEEVTAPAAAAQNNASQNKGQ